MRTPFRKTATTLLLAASASATDAAEWKIDPTIRLKAGYNDNVTLRIDDEVSSAEASLIPSAKFSVETPTSGLSGKLRFQFRRFEDDSNLDDNNVRFDVASFHRMERSELGLNLDLIKDTTLDSQLEETGLVLGRVDRLRGDVNPTWSYFFNERTRLELGYTYTDVSYSNAGGTGFVDYNAHSADASLVRVLSERTVASLTLGQTRTDNDNDVDSTYTYLQGGASYQFSETLSATLFAGVRHTESDFTEDSLIPIFSGDVIIGFAPLAKDKSNSDWGSVFSASIDKRFLRGETSFSATRDISSSVSGFLIEVTRLSWNSLYRFTEVLSGDLDLEFYNSESTNEVDTRLNRDYYAIEPRFNWDFAEFWRVSGSYRYRKQTYDNTDGDAVQNAAYLTLTYRWPRMAISR